MAMNKSDIINEINKLTAELPLVKKVAEISEHEGLEIAYNELTEKCCARVKAKSYKESKDSIKSLEIINNFQNYLNEQSERARRIEYRIEELKIELTKCQLSLFDDNEKKINTGIQFNNRDIYTGDVFELPDKSYLIIAASSEHPTNFAITGTAFEEELLLQYPKNREILCNAIYLDNLFENNKLAEFLDELEEKQAELKEEQENNSSDCEDD